MDRLTYFEHGKNRLLFEGTEYSNACVDRLAAYEDTGLTPEEIEELKAIKWWSQCGTDDMLPTIFGVPINRLRALADADRDGLCVVLPCKVGDTVDRLFSHNEIIALWEEHKLEEASPKYLLWRGMAHALPAEYKSEFWYSGRGTVLDDGVYDPKDQDGYWPFECYGEWLAYDHKPGGEQDA